MADPVSAITGKVELNSAAIAHIIRWNMEQVADNKTYVSSSTNGWAETVEGAKRWTATMDLLLEAGAFLTALVVGTLYNKIEFFTSISPSSESKYGKARVDSISGPEADIDGSGLVGCTVTVTGHGALT